MGIRLTPQAAPDEEVARGLFAAENCPHPRRWSGAPGEEYPLHGHGYHKVLFVLSGSITFEDEERRTYHMTPGDRLDVDAGTEHSATAGPEGVECMESYR
jgi:quercetin dioxygenase-like cupin family protein